MVKNNYEEYYTVNELNKVRYDPVDGIILLAVDPSDKKIIDCGAGTGILAKKLTDLGKDVTCIDIKNEFIEHLKNQGLKVVKSDIRNLPFKDKEFDLAIAEEVIEHLENPGDGLKELFRVAKKVIFTLPNIPDEWHFWLTNSAIVGNIAVLKMEQTW